MEYLPVASKLVNLLIGALFDYIVDMRKIKILLAIEDYQDHTDFQALLMKYGWDVKSVKRDFLVKDEVFSFNPEILISGGQGRQINGIKLAKTLFRKDGRPKLVLYLSPEEANAKGLGSVPIDGVIEKPFEPIKILRMFCHMSGIDEKPVLEKYRSHNSATTSEEGSTHVRGGGVGAEDLQHVQGDGGQSAAVSQQVRSTSKRNWITDERRRKIYEDAVSRVAAEELSEWDTTEMQRTMKNLREEHTPELDDLDKKRKEFVLGLFKNK